MRQLTTKYRRVAPITSRNIAEMKSTTTQSRFRQHACGVLILLTLLNPAAQANEMANLMRGMFTGLALLGQASNASGLGYGYPGAWGGHYPPGTAPLGGPWASAPGGPGTWAAPPLGGVPWNGVPWANTQLPGYSDWATRQQYNRSEPYSHLMRILQGSWETQNGGLLLVKGSLARLYLSRDRYQDLEIRADKHYVWMRPAGSRQTPDRYEHRIFDRRVILRDEDGRVLVLRRHTP